jgi:hypothetical protein
LRKLSKLNLISQLSDERRTSQHLPSESSPLRYRILR